MAPKRKRAEAQRTDEDAGALYRRVFVDSKDGETVLLDLVARFYDINTYCIGGVEAARETERRAARREVIHFILRRIGQVKND